MIPVRLYSDGTLHLFDEIVVDPTISGFSIKDNKLYVKDFIEDETLDANTPLRLDGDSTLRIRELVENMREMEIDPDAVAGEIRIYAGYTIPTGWALCDGQELNVADFPNLFAKIGITFGGNGTTTFRLPDMRGRIPIGADGKYSLGQIGGEESHQLSTSEMGDHNHIVKVNNIRDEAVYADLSDRFIGYSAGITPYQTGAINTKLASDAINPNGSSNVSHNNMMPYIATQYIISLFGE